MGFKVSELKEAGYSATELAFVEFAPRELTDGGYPFSVLKTELELEAGQLKSDGFALVELKTAGYTASELSKAGFTPHDLLEGGYALRQLRADNAFTTAELKQDGLSARDLKAADYSVQELAQADFSPREIINGGFPRTVLKDELQLSAGRLKSDGFTASELKVY